MGLYSPPQRASTEFELPKPRDQLPFLEAVTSVMCPKLELRIVIRIAPNLTFQLRARLNAANIEISNSTHEKTPIRAICWRLSIRR